MTTLGEFLDTHAPRELFLVGVGCPGGQSRTDTTRDAGTPDDDWCDLADCFNTDLIRATDGWDSLEGEVNGNRWSWNGEGDAWDVKGNNYTRIDLDGTPDE